MAQFNKLVITNKGQALAAQMIAQSGQIQFTHIRISDKTYSTSGLEGLTDIGQIKQSMDISRVIRTSDKVVQVEGAITNADLTSGYYMQTVGLYAAQSGGGEILFAVTTAVKAGYMPPHDDLTTTGAYFKLLITVSNSNSVSLVIGSSAVATIGDIRDLQRQITENKNNHQTLVNDLPQTIIDKHIDLLDNYLIYRKSGETTTYALKTNEVNEQLFYNTKIDYYHLPLNLKRIGKRAFSMSGLTSVTIPSSVVEIGERAFSNNKLTSVTIPNSVTKIGDFAFQYNRLTSVTIPSSVVEIGKLAFSNNQLTGVTIPGSITVIRAQSFQCNQLTSVAIPNSVTKIDDSAFQENRLTSVTIPGSVTIIGASSFANNQLTSVTIPSSVTSIGGYAFESNQLTSVTIPSSVTKIGMGTFRGNQLTSVTIPSSVTNIYERAFTGNQLTSVRVPSGCILDPEAFDPGVTIERY